MKLQILQENFSKAINICSRFTSSRVQLPVLANILLKTQKNNLIVSATNLETSISVSVGANVESKGEITIPSRVATELVSNLKSGQIRLDSEKELLKIKSSGFNSTIPGMNAKDFPHIPDEIPADAIDLPGNNILDSLNLCLFAVSNDETRPVLTGVLMIVKDSKLVLVATDGFRLSQVTHKIGKMKDEKRFIIPKNALSELVRLSQKDGQLQFSYKKADNQLIFATDDCVLSSRIIEGDFPDFEKIIPKDTKIKVETDREELLRAVKLASVFARDSANVVKIKMNSKGLSILAESSQSGSQASSVDAKVEGSKGEFVIAFNYRFLEDFLTAVKGDDIQMEFSDSNSPSLFIDPKDTNFLHIIMPVRLQS